MSIYDKIVNGEYEDRSQYPLKPKMPSVLIKPSFSLTFDEINGIIETKSQYEKDMETYKESVKIRKEEEQRLLDKFENDLAEEYGMSSHPKRAKLFYKAWELGHSSGLSDVAHYYDDLYELVK